MTRCALPLMLGVLLASAGCRDVIGLGKLSVDPPTRITVGPRPAGSRCAYDADCTTSYCAGGVCRRPTCSDGVTNGTETALDCGGSCGLCATGALCSTPGDCATGICAGGLCVDPSCSDGTRNGTETAIDCGGSCAGCATGAPCTTASDCASSVCTGDACQDPTCTDGVHNGPETDVDCGGGTCAPCPDAARCTVRPDCVSDVCANGVCQTPSCTDGVENGRETDVDCGGGTCLPCGRQKGCSTGSDCASTFCQQAPAGPRCAPAACGDGVKGGTETDVDCGGDCAPCANGKECARSVDCATSTCWEGLCGIPTCTDGIKNNGEGDIDCGGACGECPNGKTCGDDLDCASRYCGNGRCVPPSCRDGVTNGDETGVDCGGSSCAPCAAGTFCWKPTDCQSSVCTGAFCAGASCTSGICAAATCTDGVLNGTETEIDCGGPSCEPCSCAGLPKTCGPRGDESCCKSPVVAGGTFLRGYDGVTYTDASHPATVSDFRLDRYEITVGRFRRFVTAWLGGFRPDAGAGKHAHLNGGSGLSDGSGGYEPGWSSAWESGFAGTSAAWSANLRCSAAHPTYPTWTSVPGTNDDAPINCATWYELYAFCIWDGGFLPSEAEWSYAAAGGTEQRAYPWSVPATATAIDCTDANYLGASGGTAFCLSPSTVPLGSVGAASPTGDGKYAQADLAGSLAEWSLDSYGPSYGTPCVDCANVAAATARAYRAGSYLDDATSQLVASRRSADPASRSVTIGARCARSPGASPP